MEGEGTMDMKTQRGKKKGTVPPMVAYRWPRESCIATNHRRQSRGNNRQKGADEGHGDSATIYVIYRRLINRLMKQQLAVMIVIFYYYPSAWKEEKDRTNSEAREVDGWREDAVEEARI